MHTRSGPNCLSTPPSLYRPDKSQQTSEQQINQSPPTAPPSLSPKLAELGAAPSSSGGRGAAGGSRAGAAGGSADVPPLAGGADAGHHLAARGDGAAAGPALPDLRQGLLARHRGRQGRVVDVERGGPGAAIGHGHVGDGVGPRTVVLLVFAQRDRRRRRDGVEGRRGVGAGSAGGGLGFSVLWRLDGCIRHLRVRVRFRVHHHPVPLLSLLPARAARVGIGCGRWDVVDD